jgi:hypothetical protein
MSFKRVKQNLVYVFASIIVASFTGCRNDRSHTQSPPTTITGNLKIHYELQLTETEGVGTGSSPYEATAIHFYNEYIVIESKYNSGTLIPIKQIKILRWDKT